MKTPTVATQCESLKTRTGYASGVLAVEVLVALLVQETPRFVEGRRPIGRGEKRYNKSYFLE